MKFLSAIGMFVGMMFGAGVFALPYVVSKAGGFWSLFHFVLVFALMLFFHVLYGRVVYSLKGRHRFPGCASLILGNWGRWLAFSITLFFYYATLLAYGILAGFFLSNFFNGSFIFSLSVLFFALGGIFLFLNIKKIGSINFYLTLPIFAFLLYLFFLALPVINLDNLSFNFRSPHWFLPYGIWLFALGAFSVIPEIKDLLPHSFREFKKVIFFGILATSVFYWLFILTIIGISGAGVSEDALSGIVATASKGAVLAGSLMGLLAVFTSFLALGTDLKNIFYLDFKVGKFFSWFLVIFPPFIFFVLGVNKFAQILALAGAFGFGVSGSLIILMAEKIREKGAVLRGFLERIALIAILLGAVYQIISFIAPHSF
jgi:tryptophan-specific transport protein